MTTPGRHDPHEQLRRRMALEDRLAEYDRTGGKEEKLWFGMSARTMNLISVAILIVGGIAFWVRFPRVQGEPRRPPRVQEQNLTEVAGDTGWVLQGEIKNDTGAPLRLVKYCVQYMDGERAVAQTMVDVKDLKTGETRAIKVALPQFRPEWKRNVVRLAVEK